MNFIDLAIYARHNWWCTGYQSSKQVLWSREEIDQVSAPLSWALKLTANCSKPHHDSTFIATTINTTFRIIHKTYFIHIVYFYISIVYVSYTSQWQAGSVTAVIVWLESVSRNIFSAGLAEHAIMRIDARIKVAHWSAIYLERAFVRPTSLWAYFCFAQGKGQRAHCIDHT